MAHLKTQQFALLVIGGLALAGCSNQPPTPEVSPVPSETPSELSEAIDTISGQAESDAESEQNESREVEETVASCMAEHGFEYIPVERGIQDPNSLLSFMQPEPGDPEPGTVAYAEKYGYQLSYWEYNPVAYDLDSIHQMFGVDNDFIDPNLAITEAMSEAELLAYEVALYGPTAAWSEAEWEDYQNNFSDSNQWLGPGEDPMRDPAGCLNFASREVGADNNFEAKLDDPDYQEFEILLVELEKKVQEDARTLELIADWSSCMSDAGHNYSNPQHAVEELSEDFGELTFFRLEQLSDLDVEGAEYAEQWEAIYAQPVPGLDEFSAKEYEVAIDDATCAIQVDFAKREQAIYSEMEDEFYQDNRTLISELTARYGSVM